MWRNIIESILLGFNSNAYLKSVRKMRIPYVSSKLRHFRLFHLKATSAICTDLVSSTLELGIFPLLSVAATTRDPLSIIHSLNLCQLGYQCWRCSTCIFEIPSLSSPISLLLVAASEIPIFLRGYAAPESVINLNVNSLCLFKVK